MLKTLEIHNYVIIDHLDLSFDTGLTIVTGETGAGKSIILGALGLITGNRADTNVLKNAEKKVVIEATFSIAQHKVLQAIFKEHDLEYDEETIIRREISPSGKSRAFINDTPSNLKVLKEISGYLVSLHQQFDLLDIQKPGFQLTMLDAVADNFSLSDQFSSDYSEWNRKKKNLETLQSSLRKSKEEEDFLAFQLQELSAIELDSIDQKALETQLEVLNHADDIKQITAQLNYEINESEISISSKLLDLSRSLQNVTAYDKQLEKWSELLDQNMVELEELAKEIGSYGEQIENDPSHKQDIDQTLSVIYKLQQKHYVNTLAELIEIRDSLSKKLDSIQNSDQEVIRLEAEISDLEKKVFNQANKLTDRRTKAIPQLEKSIQSLLPDVALGNGVFKILLEPLEKPSQTGLDSIKFMFSGNPGSPIQPLKDVASGGEISRLTLCLKSVVAQKLDLATMIFDEIDTGVSGEVSLRMGKLLKALASEKQVITITHSAQVASRGDHHYYIYKEIDAGSTATRMKLLNHEARILEIAKILSGDPPSDAAMINAKELLSLQ